MEFQTLKKSYKKQIVMGVLAVCVIGGALTFATTRAKYKLTEDIPLVRGTVNYKMPDMRVVAVNISEDGTNYTEINTVPTSGYKLNTTKSICKIAATDTKDEEITIEYKEGKVNILGVTKKGTRCYLYFDKKEPGASDTILGNITINSGTPNFASVAKTDEGVYKVSDGMYGGDSYYWRGAVTNNYVKFGGFCWRIVRINGDGSIRLIYDGATCHANGTNTTENIAVEDQVYNTYSSRSSQVGWTYTEGSQRPSNIYTATASNPKTKVEEWYNANLKSYESKIASGKYCNDRDGKAGSTWADSGATFEYGAYQRLVNNKAPTLSCPSGDIYELKVGLITADELAYAGGQNGVLNNSYYLYNGQVYWTMTPERWFNGSGSGPYVYIIRSDGRIGAEILNLGYFDIGESIKNPGLRPVINLNADVKFSSGNGTQSNPYVVS